MRKILGVLFLFHFSFLTYFRDLRGVFNSAVIQLALVEYEMIFVTQRLKPRWLLIISASGLIVNFTMATVTASAFSTSFAPSPIQTNT